MTEMMNQSSQSLINDESANGFADFIQLLGVTQSLINPTTQNCKKDPVETIPVETLLVPHFF